MGCFKSVFVICLLGGCAVGEWSIQCIVRGVRGVRGFVCVLCAVCVGVCAVCVLLCTRTSMPGL